MKPLRFTVYGRPQPAGSKRAFLHPKSGRPVITDDNAKGKPWRQEAASAAARALGNGNGLLNGPLGLSVTFYLARPKGHFGTGRNAGRVRPSAPSYPTAKPDVTKLLRCLEDALTGVVWRDDAQVVAQTALKRFGEPERTEVTITSAQP